MRYKKHRELLIVLTEKLIMITIQLCSSFLAVVCGLRKFFLYCFLGSQLWWCSKYESAFVFLLVAGRSRKSSQSKSKPRVET